VEKLEWLGYPTVKKISNISLFVLAQLTIVTDRQTDGQTCTACRHSRAMHSIARQLRNVLNTNFFLLHTKFLTTSQATYLHNLVSLHSPVPSRHPFIYRHTFPTRITKCTKFGQLILRKIIKIVATRCQILRLKCTKFDFGWGSAPDPAGGAYSAPPDPLAGFKGTYF